jgi:hypothetical protein
MRRRRIYLGTLHDLFVLLSKPAAFAEVIVNLVDDLSPGSVGLRGVLDAELRRGRLVRSRRWEDGKPTHETLAGTSAVRVAPDYQYDPLSVLEGNLRDYGERALSYGDHVLLIVGSPARGGSDIGEIVIPDAVIVGVWSW